MLIHASCVALQNKAVLLVGKPGIGKSDLGLRLIAEGAQLIADDQTLLHCEADVLCASPPSTTQGIMEIRHIGLVKMPFISAVPVSLYVELTSLHETIERLPEYPPIFFLDHSVQQLRLPALAASTPAKIRAALAHAASL
jgi:serine kinase of HPr protein (carbohydrate metabolism regulator)